MKEIEELFHDLTSILEIAVAKRNFNFPLDKIKNIDIYSFDINITDMVSEDENETGVYIIVKSIDISILSKSEENLANLEAAFTFKFDNKLKHIEVKPDSYFINSELSEWFDNIVLATTRGIMYSEFRGTFVDDAILPLIKPKDLKNK